MAVLGDVETRRTARFSAADVCLPDGGFREVPRSMTSFGVSGNTDEKR